MSWRRFKALLQGLGPNTALVAVASSRASNRTTTATGKQGKGGFTITPETPPEAVSAFLNAIATKKHKARRKR